MNPDHSEGMESSERQVHAVSERALGPKSSRDTVQLPSPTSHDLPAATRSAMVTLLNQRLAGAIELFLQLRQARWNVKGPHFIALYELFGDLAGHAERWSDELAERAVQLGGVAGVATRTGTPRPPPSLRDDSLPEGFAHLEGVANALASFARAVRSVIAAAAEIDDAGTADLFTQISRQADKDLWFVEAHLYQPR
jgi:starvation-inducible DNA-binding protein